MRPWTELELEIMRGEAELQWGHGLAAVDGV